MARAEENGEGIAGGVSQEQGEFMATKKADRDIYDGLRGFTCRGLIVTATAMFFLFLGQVMHALLFAFIGVLLAVL